MISKSLRIHQTKVQIINIDTSPIREVKLIYSIRDILQQLGIECTLAKAKGCGDKVDGELLNAAADA